MTADESSLVATVQGQLQDAMNFEGSVEEKKAKALLATLGIDYDAITMEQFVNLIEVLKLSKHLKTPISQRGKTTMTRLFNGLIPHYHEGTYTGSVYLDGKDTRDLSLFDISLKVGSVFQNPRSQFFNVDTTSELAFGPENHGIAEDLVRDRVKRVAAQLKLEPLLDRSIFSLSGGEKQRISIARAILKDAPIIILDEATSSVDPENENLLMGAISELTKNKTVIMIAHRLKTVRNADQIFVLSGGHIVQTGKHEDLIRQPGIYADFIGIRKKAIGWKLK